MSSTADPSTSGPRSATESYQNVEQLIESLVSSDTPGEVATHKVSRMLTVWIFQMAVLRMTKLFKGKNLGGNDHHHGGM